MRRKRRDSSRQSSHEHCGSQSSLPSVHSSSSSSSKNSSSSSSRSSSTLVSSSGSTPTTSYSDPHSSHATTSPSSSSSTSRFKSFSHSGQLGTAASSLKAFGSYKMANLRRTTPLVLGRTRSQVKSTNSGLDGTPNCGEYTIVKPFPGPGLHAWKEGPRFTRYPQPRDTRTLTGAGAHSILLSEPRTMNRREN